MTQFYEQFKKELNPNPYWMVTVFDALEKLADYSKDENELFGVLQPSFGEMIEPVFFLIQNRDGLVKEFKEHKKKQEEENRHKNRQKQKTNGFAVSSRKKRLEKKYGTEEDALTNHTVLAMIGMDEDLISTEEKLGLKSKSLKKGLRDISELYAEDLEPEDEMIDFVNIRIDEVKQKLGLRYKKIDLPEYLVYECLPESSKNTKDKTELMAISSLPSHIQCVFKGITHLNQLQSSVKDCAFGSDENMLVCAPTGAGKTNVALLTILREVERTFNKEESKAGEFKIVYVSPLKALAAEVVDKFGAKLRTLGVKVREFTGDMGLTKQELQETHIIVATPEKWDVMTRKTDSITEMVNLIIIDEIHLLDEERGRVLECIVARTQMTIERRQKRTRLVGLSATLPNYVDVARFMKVQKGLFYFSEAYRPVPLYKKFVGVRQPKAQKQQGRRENTQNKGGKKKRTKRKDWRDVMSEVTYDIVKDNLLQGEQVLVFVHSRKDTYRTCEKLLEMAEIKQESHLFAPKPGSKRVKEHQLSNKDLKKLVVNGLGSHNAGLPRRDRRAIEEGFACGYLRVVSCTATLAWGVNLPAHAVVIKGTDIYEPGVGWKDMSILDVQQIFGRAGRPQFDTYGEAVLITKVERLNDFMGMMSNKKPIESNFESCLTEALNAEVSLGNITSVREAFDYVKRTFFYVRCRKNPIVVGAKSAAHIDGALMDIIEENIFNLHRLRLLRYDPQSGSVESTELGRIASYYYINTRTMEKFCTYLNFYDSNQGEDQARNIDLAGDIEDQNLMAILAQASEFSNLQVRQDEFQELKEIEKESFFEDVNGNFTRMLKLEKEKSGKVNTGGVTDLRQQQEKEGFDSYEKVMLLIQGYLSMLHYETYSLVADTNYIVQNGTRILRCIFEICLRKNLAYLSLTVLRWCRYMECCIRDDLTPLRVFCYENVKRGMQNVRSGFSIKKSPQFIDEMTCRKIERKEQEDTFVSLYGSIRSMRQNPEIQMVLGLSKSEGNKLNRVLKFFPLLKIEYSLRPVAQSILKVNLEIVPDFYYSKQFHYHKEVFWAIVEDKGEILHSEEFGIYTKNLIEGKRIEKVELSFFVPLRASKYPYMLFILSDRFPGADIEIELDLSEIMIHTEKMEYTDLLTLRPLAVSTLQNKKIENLYHPIKYFNPIQTQVFHALYHTDNNCLVGAPTGSGKTIISELGILRVFEHFSKGKVVYVAPYKALAKERLKDWKRKFGKGLGKSILELTGDYTPDLNALINSDILITTPEKWDGISRNWQKRSYVTHVSLIIFDEIHLLGQDRGAVIEVIVSRMNYISKQVSKKIRMIGLSTAMANGADVANWFGVPKHFMFNFKPNVRPVPVEIHFKGFSEKNYCPRMNSMNKPAYNDIKKFAFNAPVMVNFFLIF